jgi:integrase
MIKRDELIFKEISPAFLERFDAYLRAAGCKTNTVSVYLRNIRALLNDAIDDDLIRQDIYPFRKFRIRQESTPKRSLSVDELRRLYAFRHEYDGIERFHAWALDVFFLSFYMIGANLKDLLYMERANMINGRMYYYRAKTSRLYSVLVLPEADEIIKRYQGKKYVLDVIERKRMAMGDRKSGEDLHKDVTGYLNRRLKEVAAMVGISVRVSSYYARHSWATIASSLNVQRDVIAHALGHGTNTVTDIYIDFEMDKVDEANRKVVDAILRPR